MTALHISLRPWHDDGRRRRRRMVGGRINPWRNQYERQELELQSMNDVSSAIQVLQQHPSKLLHCTTYPLSTIVQSTPVSGATQVRMLLPSFNNNHRVCKFHRRNGCKHSTSSSALAYTVDIKHTEAVTPRKAQEDKRIRVHWCAADSKLSTDSPEARCY